MAPITSEAKIHPRAADALSAVALLRRDFQPSSYKALSSTYSTGPAYFKAIKLLDDARDIKWESPHSAAVLLNEKMRIMHLHGASEKYLKPIRLEAVHLYLQAAEAKFSQDSTRWVSRQLFGTALVIASLNGDNLMSHFVAKQWYHLELNLRGGKVVYTADEISDFAQSKNLEGLAFVSIKLFSIASEAKKQYDFITYIEAASLAYPGLPAGSMKQNAWKLLNSDWHTPSKQ